MIITMNIEVSIRNAMDDSTNLTSQTSLHELQIYFISDKISSLIYIK